MPAIENEPEVTETPTALATQSSIGIIYPPPEVRNIVDKTASFVARNGPEFESRIRQNEINNQKFNFLNLTDPYHNYYKHKVKEFSEGKGQEPSSAVKSGLGFLQQKPQQEVSKLLEDQLPKEAPPDFEFVADPPSISAYDLDIVRLTAQFVARNGRQFLTNLMNREQRNYQFDFLRPQHSLFNYFTKLVEQYTKILIPSKLMLAQVKSECGGGGVIYKESMRRVDWLKHQEKAKKKDEDDKEKDRVAYAQIDWHDFVVVETVDYQPGETGSFPPSTTAQEVGARVLAQERFDKDNEEEPKGDGDVESEEENKEEEDVGDGEVLESDEGSDMEESDGEESTSLPLANALSNQVKQKTEVVESNLQAGAKGKDTGLAASTKPLDVPLPQPPLSSKSENIIIRKDYDPKAAKEVDVEPASDRFLISPITGERIPTEKIQEHMRIGLLDPRWIEQRDRAIQERREQEGVYAPGSAIGSSLKMLAELRSDIFGVGAEETQIGKKVGEEEKKEKVKVVWDGHSGSMEKVVQRARENITVEEQIAVIHKVKGLVQDSDKEKIGPSVPGGSQGVERPPLPSQPPNRPTNLPPGQTMLRPPLIPPRPPTILPQPPLPPPGGMGMMIPPPVRPNFMLPVRPPMPPQPDQDDEPSSKRSKTEEQLMDESEFLRRHPYPSTFRVLLPQVPNAEWPLQGQSFHFTLPPTDPISVIKAKISDEIGMPMGKQKLQLDGMFLKDGNTLAYYNIGGSSVVQLQVKERGGRKK